MWKPRRLFEPLAVARIVEGGSVLCPVQLRDTHIEGCLGCSFLGDVTEDELGSVSEIVCKPPLRELVGSEAH
jgi:hypothetical protein